MVRFITEHNAGIFLAPLIGFASYIGVMALSMGLLFWFMRRDQRLKR